jgi:TonB family protein
MFTAVIAAFALAGALPTPQATAPGGHADCVRARSFARRGIDEANLSRQFYDRGDPTQAGSTAERATIDLLSSRNLGIERCDSSVHPRRIDVYRAVGAAGSTLALTTGGSPAERALRLQEAIRMQTIVRGFYRPDTPAYRAVTRDVAYLQQKYTEQVLLAEKHPSGTTRFAAPVPGPPTPRPTDTPEPVEQTNASPGPFSPPTTCARPNVPPLVVRAVAPVMPTLAMQQRITGDVTVEVSLDAQSQILKLKVVSSPSTIVNAAALAATQQSTFQTEIRECRPLPSTLRFIVTFAAQ